MLPFQIQEELQKRPCPVCRLVSQPGCSSGSFPSAQVPSREGVIGCPAKHPNKSLIMVIFMHGNCLEVFLLNLNKISRHLGLCLSNISERR